MIVTIYINELILHSTCCIAIIMYYVWTYLAIKNQSVTNSPMRKGGPVDYITTFLIVVAPILLILALIMYMSKNNTSLSSLVGFYIYFIFFFSFLYCSCNWHYPGTISGIRCNNWEAEFKYFLISVQTQTTVGYTEAKPIDVLTESVSIVQVILGLFFVIIFVAKTVSGIH